MNTEKNSNFTENSIYLPSTNDKRNKQTVVQEVNHKVFKVC